MDQLELSVSLLAKVSLSISMQYQFSYFWTHLFLVCWFVCPQEHYKNITYLAKVISIKTFLN